MEATINSIIVQHKWGFENADCWRVRPSPILVPNEVSSIAVGKKIKDNALMTSFWYYTLAGF